VILDEPERAAIIAATAGHRSIAPESAPWEIGNAFTGMFKRKTVTVEQATQALKSFEQMTLTFVPVDLLASVQLAAECRIYAYDAYMLQCARQYDAPLLTLDRPMISHAESLAIKTIKVTP